MVDLIVWVVAALYLVLPINLLMLLGIRQQVIKLRISDARTHDRRKW